LFSALKSQFHKDPKGLALPPLAPVVWGLEENRRPKQLSLLLLEPV